MGLGPTPRHGEVLKVKAIVTVRIVLVVVILVKMKATIIKVIVIDMMLMSGDCDAEGITTVVVMLSRGH